MTATTAAPQLFVNKTGAVVAVLVVFILGLSIAALTQLTIPESNHDILLVLVTAVATNVTSIVSYFFGSSSGTRAKDDTIAAQASTIATTVPAVAPSGADKTINLDPGQTGAVHANEPRP